MKESQNPEKINTIQQLFDTVPCGYVLTDDEGGILRVNASLCDSLGWSREELEGKKKFTDLVSLGGRLYYQTTHAPLLKLQSEVRELSYKLVTKTGKRIPVLVNSSRQKMQTEDQSFFSENLDASPNVANLKSLTQFIIFPFHDRQKFEEELLIAKKQAESAAEAKSVFLSTMTHELRNPIHSILNAGNLLTLDSISEENRELLDIIHYSAEGLLELVNSVLDMSKMEAGNISLNEKSFNLRRLLHRIVQSFRPQAEQKGLSLEWSVSTELPLQFVADEMKIKQILTNLVGNAVKFTKEGFVRLNLDYDEAKNELHFAVEDSGIGINPNNVEKIFTPFSQANKSIHTNFGGTGLGLSISQKILEAYGSHLELSGEEGKGATFSFKLQLESAPEVPFNPVAIKRQFQSLSHLKVLVADDVKSNLIIIGRYFKKWDIAYETANNGEEALDLIFENDYDLVFLDIGMPVISGLDVAKTIRKREEKKYQELPLVALTAYDRKDMEDAVSQSGMSAMVQKPFSEGELYEVICEHIVVETKNKVEENSIEKPEVNFASIYDIFEDDKPDIKNYLQAVCNDFDKTMLDFVQAEADYDLVAYRDAVHKLNSIVRMLELEKLSALLSRQRQFLEADNRVEFDKFGQERLLMMRRVRGLVQSEMSAQNA